MMFLEEKPELNITPLVDIMLVLLAILMVTTPSITYEENVNLPKGSQQSSSSATLKSLIISITKEREIFINDKKFDYTGFADNLVILKSSFKLDEPVFIRADKDLRYDDVIFVLKTVKNLGFNKVSLQTE
ncbi:ExbD/TolR family protein [Campylobacter troglodytis]|uniref:ExbD/TolR family protein n=1 Tax=Campylobacter troglodytis TaxID=654363 RepID=UPI00115BDB47|nr:ExbD/TolR family protein [Campylobacter troglodytis]TQR61380.1 biopolymer transporter ExbD [Campylobacter troglodytis]